MINTKLGSHDNRIVSALLLAGLLSALITIVLFWISPFLVPGLVFGVVVASFVGKLGVFTQRQAGWFTAVAMLSHAAAHYLVFALQPRFAVSMGNPDADPPFAFLAGGLLGGFLVVGALPLILDRRAGKRAVVVGALPWAIGGAALGGGLAVTGILFGPTLGAGVVELFRVLHLLPFHGNVRMRPPDDWYSLYLIWQIGIALMLGIIVRRYVVMNSIAEAGQK